MLDSRPTWKIHRVLDERKSLVDELTRSYKLLSGFAREYASIASITQTFTSILEDYIRKYPEQYFWFHRRWKTQPV